MSPHSYSEVCLEALTESDFPIVAQLGATIWRAHYVTMVSMAQIEYMLAGRYVPDKLRLYLNADDRWMELLKLDGAAVGYCSYARTPTPDEMKLEQLYLLKECRGRGFGGIMLQHVVSQARRQGCRTLVLTVNKANSASIAFYRRTGFTVREAARFDIGNGFVMDDYVMEKAL